MKTNGLINKKLRICSIAVITACLLTIVLIINEPILTTKAHIQYSDELETTENSFLFSGNEEFKEFFNYLCLTDLIIRETHTENTWFGEEPMTDDEFAQYMIFQYLFGTEMKAAAYSDNERYVTQWYYVRENYKDTVFYSNYGFYTYSYFWLCAPKYRQSLLALALSVAPNAKSIDDNWNYIKANYPETYEILRQDYWKDNYVFPEPSQTMLQNFNKETAPYFWMGTVAEIITGGGVTTYGNESDHGIYNGTRIYELYKLFRPEVFNIGLTPTTAKYVGKKIAQHDKSIYYDTDNDKLVQVDPEVNSYSNISYPTWGLFYYNKNQYEVFHGRIRSWNYEGFLDMGSWAPSVGYDYWKDIRPGETSTEKAYIRAYGDYIWQVDDELPANPEVYFTELSKHGIDLTGTEYEKYVKASEATPTATPTPVPTKIPVEGSATPIPTPATIPTGTETVEPTSTVNEPTPTPIEGTTDVEPTGDMEATPTPAEGEEPTGTEPTGEDTPTEEPEPTKSSEPTPTQSGAMAGTYENVTPTPKPAPETSDGATPTSDVIAAQYATPTPKPDGSGYSEKSKFQSFLDSGAVVPTSIAVAVVVIGAIALVVIKKKKS